MLFRSADPYGFCIMTANPVFKWGLAALICVAWGSVWHLDGPSDIEAMTDVAADVADAQACAQLAAATNRRGAP